jgi:hypothetical protein
VGNKHATTAGAVTAGEISAAGPALRNGSEGAVSARFP